MARFVGSLSTQEAKDMSKQLETVLGIPYRKNFDYLRLLEIFVVYKITEDVRRKRNIAETDERTPVSVELPLFGKLTITPTVFHKKHGKAGHPSNHYKFEFVPTSGFKSDINRAFVDGESDLPLHLAELYGERLKEIYRNLGDLIEQQ